MARVFIDGFEDGKGSLWDNNAYSSPIIRSVSGCTGSYCGTGQAQKTFSDSYSFLYVAFKWSDYDAMWSGRQICSFKNGNTILAAINFESDYGHLCIYEGNENTLLAEGSVDITAGRIWHRIEIYYLPHLTNGTFQVKVDGVLECNVSGVKTAPSTTNIDRFCFGEIPVTTGMGHAFDDLVIDDSDWIGNTYIQAIVPTGNTATGGKNEWDASTGNNWDCVNDKPYNDSDYISTNTVDEIENYATEDLTGSIISVKSIQVQARIAYEGAPTPTHVQLGVRCAGADYFADNKTPAASFSTVDRLLEHNPNGEVDWTESSVNALEMSVKATA